MASAKQLFEETAAVPGHVAPNDLFGSASPERGAVISACGLYRYTLWWTWGAGPRVNWCCLNPSKADATVNDPSFMRMVRFTQSWGYGGLIVTNLFAFRATNPRDMIAAPDPVGEDNDYWIQTCSMQSALTVAGWGSGGAYLGRGVEVRRMLHAPHYLRLTKDGHPGHPLYLPADLKPQRWVQW